MTELAGPKSPDALYLARGSETPRCRPVMTGDVFGEVSIPGVEDSAGLAMVVAHPCSMREGAHLRSHVHMARVSSEAPIPLPGWRGHYGVMPLPDLTGPSDATQRAVFELSGRVPTASLAPERRIACLDNGGIILLLQRLAFNLTRVAVELEVIYDSIAPILDEAELLEDWIAERTKSETTDWSAAIAREEESFDRAMIEEVDGSSMRKRLQDRSNRAAVQRHIRERTQAA